MGPSTTCPTTDLSSRLTYPMTWQISIDNEFSKLPVSVASRYYFCIVRSITIGENGVNSTSKIKKIGRYLVKTNVSLS